MAWKTEGFGWIPSHPDHRDYAFAVPMVESLPPWVDLHSKFPPIWNQGHEGSCTAHGALAGYCYDRKKLGLPEFDPSRAYQYFNSRALMGSTAADTGCTVRLAIKAIARWGACPDSMFPYATEHVYTRPPDAAYAEGEKHKAIQYYSLGGMFHPTIAQMKQTLASGFPFVFGFTVYSNFMQQTGRTGLMPWPSGVPEGGHCVICTGYNSRGLFCARNSWGPRWGDPDMPGHFWMPPEIIGHPQLSSDFWVIQAVQP